MTLGKDLKEVVGQAMWIFGGERIPGRENGSCKGPELYLTETPEEPPV